MRAVLARPVGGEGGRGKESAMSYGQEPFKDERHQRHTQRLQPYFRQAATFAGLHLACRLPKCRRAKRCTRYIAVRPSLKRAVAAGPTAVPFSGRIGRRALRPGRSRLTVVVADAAGNRSKPRSIGFRVVRR